MRPLEGDEPTAVGPHRLLGRPVPGGGRRGHRPAARRHRARTGRGPGRGAGGGARTGTGAPGREALERPPHPRRPAAHRLRHRPRPGRHGVPDDDGRVDRLPRLHAPEQVLGEGVTGAADVFSPGAVPAYAATGRPPFSGDTSAALLYKVVHEEPEPEGLDGEVRAGGGVPEQGPGRTADPGRGVPAACPRGRRPDDGRRVAAGGAGGAGEPGRGATAEPGGGGGLTGAGVRAGGLQPSVGEAPTADAATGAAAEGAAVEGRPRAPPPPVARAAARRADAYRPARRRCSRSPPPRASGRGAGRERAGAAGGFGRSREPAHRSR